MKTGIKFLCIVHFAIYLVGMSSSMAAQEVTISGIVKALSSEEVTIENAKVEIYELNHGKLTRNDLKLQKSVLSDAAGRFRLELKASEHIYEFTERIYKLTLRVSASGYHESLVSIEGLEDASYPFESQHTVYLRSKQSELHEVKVRSLHLYEDRTIFREVEGERKRFEVPDQLGEIKRALGRANWNPNDVNVRQAIEKLQPVTGYVITAAGYRPLDPRVGYIFSDHSGYRLLRMICPGGKSFTTGLDKLTDEDRWLRAQTFRVVGSILDESEELSLPPHLRLAIKEYGPLFRGHFEPLLVLELENRGSALHVIDQVIAEISDVEMYLGPDEKAGVSLQTHDIFVEPKVGAVQSRLAMPITLYPSGDLEGRDIIRFLVRLNPLTPYLHYWRMRFVLITSENRFVATDYFEIDM